MHVGPSVEESNLSSIAALVAVVADVARLVHVLDAVDEESQGETAILDRRARVLRATLNSLILSTTQPFVETSPENRAS